jgi:flagellar basal-body rod modification protein FlgD
MSSITSTTSVFGAAATPAAPQTAGRGMDKLGQADFVRLLTVQLQQQDPFQPVDNKEMLAQMAQFSSLGGINDTNALLETISSKLDRLTAAQQSTATTQES